MIFENLLFGWSCWDHGDGSLHCVSSSAFDLASRRPTGNTHVSIVSGQQKPQKERCEAAASFRLFLHMRFRLFRPKSCGDFDATKSHNHQMGSSCHKSIHAYKSDDMILRMCPPSSHNSLWWRIFVTAFPRSWKEHTTGKHWAPSSGTWCFLWLPQRKTHHK